MWLATFFVVGSFYSKSIFPHYGGPTALTLSWDRLSSNLAIVNIRQVSYVSSVAFFSWLPHPPKPCDKAFIVSAVVFHWEEAVE